LNRVVVDVVSPLLFFDSVIRCRLSVNLSTRITRACPTGVFIRGWQRRRAGLGFLGRGSNPSPPAVGLGERCERGSGRSPDHPKVSTVFGTWMASPDTIILLIVDYNHATIGEYLRTYLLTYVLTHAPDM